MANTHIANTSSLACQKTNPAVAVIAIKVSETLEVVSAEDSRLISRITLTLRNAAMGARPNPKVISKPEISPANTGRTDGEGSSTASARPAR